MFIIDQSQTYTWPVEVEFPVDGGKTRKETFDGEFKRLSESRIREIQDQINNNEIVHDKILAREILVGWKGVVDNKGEEVPFSQAGLDKLLEVPLVATAIVRSFYKSHAGARIKN